MLTDGQRRNLEDLAGRKDSAVELANDQQVAYWRKLEAGGYVHLADSAICGIERVRGNFVSITEAGRLAIAPSS